MRLEWSSMGPLSEKVLTLRRQKHRRPKTEDLTPEDMYETAFRVKVQFKDGEKHFAFDPNLFNYDQLTFILTKAFNIKVPFIVSYMRRAECCKGCESECMDDSYDDITSFFNFIPNHHTSKTVFDSPYYAYDSLSSDRFQQSIGPSKSCKHLCSTFFRDGDMIPILSDYDLDGAVLNAADIRLLLLHIETVEESCEVFNEEEWDMIEVRGVTDDSIYFNTLEDSNRNLNSMFCTLPHKPNKRKMLRPRVLSTADEVEEHKVSFSQWLGLLDSKGRILDHQEFRRSVFHHTVKNNFRHIVWKHLLGLYPYNTTFEERKAHIERLKSDYEYLKEEAFHRRLAPSIVSLIQKDVVRTDRHVSYFNKDFDHPNIQKLYRILYVYANNNHDVEYAQGMSDLAAVFVCTIPDEALAYFCYSKYMEHNKGKFLINSEVISTCFYQLTRLLKKFDPELYEYLVKIGSQTLLFCYRWFLLDLKREFCLTDALRFMDTYFACVRQPEAGESHFSRVIKDVQHYTSLMGTDDDTRNMYLRAVRLFYCENVRRTIESYRHSFPVYGCLALLKIHKRQIIKKSLKLDTITIFYEKLIRKQDVDQVLSLAKEYYLLDIEQQLQKLSKTHHNDLLTTSIADINKKSSWKFL